MHGLPFLEDLAEGTCGRKKRAHLDVLLDGVQGEVTRDLELGLLTARDLNHHVGNSLLLVHPEGDIVEGRNNILALLCNCGKKDAKCQLWRTERGTECFWTSSKTLCDVRK